MLVVAACGNDQAITASPPQDPGLVAGTVSAYVARPSITVRNGTEFQVGFVLVEPGLPMAAVFPPCVSNCATLKPGAGVVVPYSSIVGHTDKSGAATMFWWRYNVLADGTLQAFGALETRTLTLN